MSKTWRPTKLNNSTVRKLIDGFKNDFTDSEACSYAGISRDTFYRHLKEDKDFSDKIEQAKNLIFILAKKNILKAIRKGDSKMSLRFLEKRQRATYWKEIPPTEEPTTPSDIFQRNWGNF